mmetsp:Transcript_46823/g.98323  ORF Transcript_46823/g.98323 Transcript_46823/m.98323 type:complete len:223 (-) Transcript_46823:1082-1750(-)
MIFSLFVGLAYLVISSNALSINRRHYLQWQTGGCIATLTTPSAAAQAAATPKSRTEGYAVQHTEREWAYILSGAQYNILRKGGTERQKSSILNTFTTANAGTYTCAGCGTPLFASQDKFSSGTGWPSFSVALSGVEAEEVDAVRATLDGREVRCGTCGGHLGDLFNDGWIYRGTSAAKTGKRYCIDGAALIFKPEGGGEDVFGDDPPPNRVIQYQPSMYRDT